jgi:hypothetical protein
MGCAVGCWEALCREKERRARKMRRKREQMDSRMRGSMSIMKVYQLSSAGAGINTKPRLCRNFSGKAGATSTFTSMLFSMLRY